QRFTVRRQNNHRIGGQPGHRNFPSQLPIRHATAPPIRLLFCCRKAASLILPSYLHARRSRNFRSAVLVHPSGIEGLIFGSWATLSGERLSCVGPAEGPGHGGVEISDELLDPGLQHLLAGEVAAADKLSYQNGKPDFDLIEP